MKFQWSCPVISQQLLESSCTGHTSYRKRTMMGGLRSITDHCRDGSRELSHILLLSSTNYLNLTTDLLIRRGFWLVGSTQALRLQSCLRCEGFKLGRPVISSLIALCLDFTKKETQIFIRLSRTDLQRVRKIISYFITQPYNARVVTVKDAFCHIVPKPPKYCLNGLVYIFLLFYVT